MKTFMDNAGRTWNVALNVTAIKRVKSLTGLDLLDAVNDGGTMLEKLAGDPVTLCDVVYAVCKDQADAQNIADVDFGGAMAGDALGGATTALLEELVDFFHGGKRDLFRRGLVKMRAYQEKYFRAACLKMDDPAMDAKVERAIEKIMQAGGDEGDSTPGTSYTSAQE